MPRNFLDFDRENPDNAFRPLTPDEQPPPEGSQLARHPYVRYLLRKVASQAETIQAMSRVQREMVNRTLVVGRNLEPLNPAPIGVLEPLNGLPTIVHVDTLRMTANRVLDKDDPTIRILVGGENAAPLHAHWVQMDDCELHQLPVALPHRSGARVVLRTHRPIVVLR